MNNSIKLLTLLIASSFSALSVNAQESANLHNREVAESRYEAFKKGNATDPLEDIRKGYRTSYGEALLGGILDSRATLKSEILAQETERLSSFIESLSTSRDEKRRSLYESSINSDGTVDYDSFASSYSDYLIGNRDAVSSTIGVRQDFAYNVMNRTSQAMHEAGDVYSHNANVAAKNIIDIINADTIDYTKTVSERLDSAMSQTRRRTPVSEQTVVLANTFDGECGDACYFPPPPEVEEDPCYYDDKNYIFKEEDEYSEYGMWEEFREYTEYVLNGVRVYYYGKSTNNRNGGRWETEERESGSKNGYSVGKHMTGGFEGGMYGSREWDRYEICVVN